MGVKMTNSDDFEGSSRLKLKRPSQDLSAPLNKSSLTILFTSSNSLLSGSLPSSWASRLYWIYRYTAI
jgi:hypothetical protein